MPDRPRVDNVGIDGEGDGHVRRPGPAGDGARRFAASNTSSTRRRSCSDWPVSAETTRKTARLTATPMMPPVMLPRARMSPG